MAEERQFAVFDPGAVARKKLQAIEERFGVDRVNRLMLTFFRRQAPLAAGYIRRNMLSGQLLKRRSQKLATGVEGLANEVAGVPSIRVGVFRGPALLYAKAQEEGAEILPKNAKALAMPVGNAVTAGGQPRYDGPRSYPGDLKFIPFTKSGIAIGGLYDVNELAKAKKNGRDLSSIQAAFILLRRTRLKGVHYLRNGMAQYLPIMAKEFLKYARDVYAGRARTFGN